MMDCGFKTINSYSERRVVYVHTINVVCDRSIIHVGDYYYRILLEYLDEHGDCGTTYIFEKCFQSIDDAFAFADKIVSKYPPINLLELDDDDNEFNHAPFLDLDDIM